MTEKRPAKEWLRRYLPERSNEDLRAELLCQDPPYGITEDCQSAIYGAQETQLCVGKTQCSDCLVIKGDADKRNEIDHSNHKA